MMRNYLSKEDNVFLVNTVAIIVLLPAFNFYLNNIVKHLMGRVLPISVLLYGMLFVFELISLYKLHNKSMVNRLSVNISFIAVVMTLISFLIYNEYIGKVLIAPNLNLLESQALHFVVFCLTAFIISSSITNWEGIIRPFSLLSPVIVVMGLYAFYLQGFSTYGEGKMDYMSLSYHMLTSGCFCFFFFLEKKQIIYGVLSFVCLFVILAAGCRGALLCFMFFVLILVQRNYLSFNSRKSIFLKIVVFALVIIILMSSFFSLSSLTNWFDNLGISSRAVDMMNDGTFLEDNARFDIRSIIWAGIEENPFGYGLFGDRYITSKYYILGADYAHNLIYELLSDFGFFVSFLIVLILFVMTRSFYKKFKNDYIWFLFLMFVPEGFIQLFFSGSYLLNVKTWILLAFLINRKRILFLNKV